jgi:predicted class III extradiol MEMO1 family dioxygenase
MQHIEMKEPGAFAKYLKETRNTICGRHAIQTWLNAVVHSERVGKDNGGNDSRALIIEFNKYAQSSNVRSMNESSVSYATAIARVSRPS